jgi:hypothetical protein|tara:strand:+ start:248 stop:478 length:231 start_codon:yes stop_codon:yes gene_type:complete
MRRSSSTIPFGYKLNDEDSSQLIEIPSEIEALEAVVPLIKERTMSLREGSLYLEAMTGRYLSHVGLKKISETRSFG